MGEDDRDLGRRADYRERLTDGLATALEPHARERTIWDAQLPGFGLRIRQTGFRCYIITYRSPRTGKQVKQTIGDARRLTVAEARSKARTLLAQVALGDDPKLSTRPRSVTVHNAYELYRERSIPNLSPVWGRKTQALIERNLLPKYGSVGIESLSRAEVRSVIERVLLAKPNTALQLHRVISAFLSWSVGHDLVTGNVLKGSKLPIRPRSRDRVLNDHEIAAVLRAADQLPQPWPAYVRLLLLTAQRKSEVLGLHASEITGTIWALPGYRTKNRTHHQVPLSKQAQSIVAALLVPDGHLFRVFERSTPMKFRQDIMVEFRSLAKVPHFTLHDLRRTAASKMAELGVAPHVIEAVLNHRSGVISGVAAIYNRYNYADEKREALQRWADRLDEIEREFPDPLDGIEI